ncbi:MAG: hypothetical protein ACLR8P_03225 [Clostridium fessum]
MRRYEMDLCAGALWKENFVVCDVPLMFTNLAQVALWHLSVGCRSGRKFAGSLALGSVGSTSILVTMFTGILIGMAAASMR